mgnify:CR=1 FL=1
MTGRESAGGARPAAAMICGDCAYLTGEPDDYAVLVELLQPLRKAGVRVTLIDQYGPANSRST